MSEIYEKEQGHTYLMAGNQVVAIFVPDETDAKMENGVSGNIYEVTAWETGDIPFELDFFCRFSVKWDGCSHFWFFGNEYTVEKGMEPQMEAYYHICGAEYFVKHMRLMAFAYELKVLKAGMNERFVHENKDYESLKALGLLNGYTIVKN
ncbi:hypothetical protein [Paenibacillus agilis]|uniref:Uncharacterized protein n=1 Tax=Paenibacillus agilis TaxID=3020863 RepID=A0A559IEG3_9BACL|nr:hypothetical protein [Paenibacillus agilis]TVX86042.1 hypothetical protein FPZ44_24170 [Paenibacillus agilis]